MNALLAYDYKYIETKIRTYSDKGYTNFRGLNMPEDGVVYESFIIISIDSLLLYENKYYRQVYIDNCAYKVIDKQMIDYLDDNLFEADED